MNLQTQSPSAPLTQHWAWRYYITAVLNHPRRVLMLAGVLALLSMSQLSNVRFDATSETLVVEGDPEFVEYVELEQRFPSDEFILVTLTPNTELFSEQGMRLLGEVQTALDAVPGVASTTSLLDIPFVASDGLDSLRSNPELRSEAASYFRSNPLFYRQLLSEDAHSASIRVTLESLSPQFQRADRAHTIQSIVAVRDRYAQDAVLRFGGVPLIAHDMMRYIKADVASFGVGCLIVMSIMLMVFFRQVRWLSLALLSAATTIVLMLGVLGALHTPISVVSANFVALLTIVSISLSIHLTVKFRELTWFGPGQTHAERVAQTMYDKFAPCAYTALTTVIAFSSLLTAGIPPVEDFGWIMSLGVGVAFVVAYSVSPALLLLLPSKPQGQVAYKPVRFSILLGRTARQFPKSIAGLSIALLAGALFGASLLSLDSQFSRYFKPQSDIRSGLEYIDHQFGGVLPLSIVLASEPYQPIEVAPDDDFFVESDDTATYPEAVWFTQARIRQAEQLSAYLREHPLVGSVTALSDLENLAQVGNGGRTLDDTTLAIFIAALGSSRAALIEPYANPHSGELRLSVRMKESAPPTGYPEVVAEIEQYAQQALQLEANEVSTSGMFILFGQSIRQLYDSQRNTLLYVAISILVMFVLLLRTIKFGLVGLAVNLIAAAVILGAMGIAKIPLDMMTITIAAITIGIGVDDAFHYLHRYRKERGHGLGVADAVTACHRSIGRAIFFTSVTVMTGFSILALSNFIPTIYFGVLTAFAMLVALLANLLLLPAWLQIVDSD